MSYEPVYGYDEMVDRLIDSVCEAEPGSQEQTNMVKSLTQAMQSSAEVGKITDDYVFQKERLELEKLKAVTESKIRSCQNRNELLKVVGDLILRTAGLGAVVGALIFGYKADFDPEAIQRSKTWRTVANWLRIKI